LKPSTEPEELTQVIGQGAAPHLGPPTSKVSPRFLFRILAVFAYKLAHANWACVILPELTVDFEDRETNEQYPDLTKRTKPRPLEIAATPRTYNPPNPSEVRKAIFRGIPAAAFAMSNSGGIPRGADSSGTVGKSTPPLQQQHQASQDKEREAGDMMSDGEYEDEKRDEEFVLRSVELAKKQATEAILKLQEKRLALVMEQAEDKVKKNPQLDAAELDEEYEKVRDIYERTQNCLAQLCSYRVTVSLAPEDLP
ncbi:hypothetical protein BJ508DRAFT_316386, partial [Ascobolus immersus RN42]